MHNFIRYVLFEQNWQAVYKIMSTLPSAVFLVPLSVKKKKHVYNSIYVKD